MKLATKVTLTFNNKFYKQIDRCTMGGPLSVTLSDIYIYMSIYIYIYIYLYIYIYIYMVKMEIEVVRPLTPLFYSRYVDDIYNRRTEHEFDT